MTDTAKALRDIARELDAVNGGGETRSCRTGWRSSSPRRRRAAVRDRALPRAAGGEAGGAFHRRRQDLVDGQCAARAGGGDPGRRDAELHAGGFLPDEGADAQGRPDHRGHLHRGAARGHAREAAGPDRRRRQDQVPRPEDPDPVPRHQPRPLPPLRRLRGDGHLREAARPDGQQPDLAGAERQGALGVTDGRAGGDRAAVARPRRGPSSRRTFKRRGSRSRRRTPPSTRRRTRRRWARPWPTSGSTRCWGFCTAPRDARPSSGCSSPGTSRNRSPSTPRHERGRRHLRRLGEPEERAPAGHGEVRPGWSAS